MRVRVQRHGGYRGEETPRRILIGDHAVAVAEVLDAWLAPDHRYFKVLSDDHEVYLLRHDVDADAWELRRVKHRG
jgi:hypothetical protein